MNVRCRYVPWFVAMIACFAAAAVVAALVTERRAPDKGTVQNETASRRVVEQRDKDEESPLLVTPAGRLRHLLARFQPLSNVLEVVSTGIFVDAHGVQTGYKVVVKNAGSENVEYDLYGEEFLSLRERLDENGEWDLEPWEHCGEGVMRYELQPGQVATLRIRRNGYVPETLRLLGLFFEGRERAGVIVLVDESKGKSSPNPAHTSDRN
jgi:hypothetical protein